MGKPVRESGSMSTLVLSCLIINLAKINVFHVKHGFKPVLLIDDLFFGIDDKNLQLVINLLMSSKAQCFLTAPKMKSFDGVRLPGERRHKNRLDKGPRNINEELVNKIKSLS